MQLAVSNGLLKFYGRPVNGRSGDQVNVRFDEAWQGMVRFAEVRQGITFKQIMLDTDSRFVLPKLEADKPFAVTLVGRSGSTTITTQQLYILGVG